MRSACVPPQIAVSGTGAPCPDADPIANGGSEFRRGQIAATGIVRQNQILRFMGLQRLAPIAEEFVERLSSTRIWKA